jgi:hypothetical protein
METPENRTEDKPTKIEETQDVSTVNSKDGYKIWTRYWKVSLDSAFGKLTNPSQGD